MIDKNSELFKDLVEEVKNHFPPNRGTFCSLETHSNVKRSEGIDYFCDRWFDCSNCPQRITTLDKLKKEITKDISNKKNEFKYSFIRKKFKYYGIETSIRLADNSKIAEYILEMEEEDLREKEKIVFDTNISSNYTILIGEMINDYTEQQQLVNNVNSFLYGEFMRAVSTEGIELGFPSHISAGDYFYNR